MYDKYDKNLISNQNLYYANLKREKRIKDQTEEMEREKIAMENLKNQMDKEKQYEFERKNRIKQAQYEDYNNYLRQKYSTPPQYRENLNIKLGGENRNIKKTNYNEEMDNLCINPTTEKHECPNAINYSEMGRKYQKGYSHGYNIITGEVYSENDNYNKNNNTNEDYNKKEEINNCNKEEKIEKNNENKGICISLEEYQEFLKYKEMKRQKEMEKQYMQKQNFNNNNINNYDNQRINNDYRDEKMQNYIQKEKEYINNEYINRKEKEKQKNNFHYEEKNEPKRFDEIKEKENFIKQQNKYYEDYQRRQLMERQSYENNNYPIYNQDYNKIPQYYYQEPNNRNEQEMLYEDNRYQKRNINDNEYIPRNIEENRYEYNQNNENRIEEKQKNIYNDNIDKYNNEEYEEQIQFNNNINFQENQQINKNNKEQLLEKYRQNDNQNEIKEMERAKYIQFLKEQSEKQYEINNKEQNYFNQNKEINDNNNQYNDLKEYKNENELPIPEKEPNKEYLSYKEQIERIKNQKEINEKKEIPSNDQRTLDYNMNNIKKEYANDNIFRREQTPKIEPKYNNEPLTEKEKKEIIKNEYGKYLDWQINERNNKVKTPYYQKNYNPILDDNEQNNNYEKYTQEENIMKNIPVDPYRNKRNDYGYFGNNYYIKK